MKSGTLLQISSASFVPSTVTDEAQELSDLIGAIYDAAIDPPRWMEVLERAMHFINGMGASLYSKNAALPSGHIHYVTGISPDYQRSYFEKYVAFDPTTTGQFIADVDEPVGIEDILPYRDFVETRFYQEWVRPQGMADCLNTVLDKSLTNVAMFGVFRSDRNGVADDRARHRMRLIAPHIRRAVMIGRMFDLKAAEAATFADAFDGLSASTYLVGADGRIVHANIAGHTLLDAADVLRTVAGRIVACDTQADRIFREAFAASHHGDAAMGTKGIAVPLQARSGDHYVAHLLPLTSGARRQAGLIHAATVALFVRKAEVTITSPPEIIGKSFRLTPSELRVLMAIVEIGGVPDVARALGVAETTIKTHLGRLFEKTGATRQADLVKLFAAFATPLLG